MRLGFCLAGFAMALAGCSGEALLEKARADLGCAPVAGLKAISGRNQPGYIIVGEFIETNEAPAAFAELACNLAASGEPLYVGVSEYLGGATDAEMKMRARLDALVSSGAPIFVGVISDQDREWNPRDRTGTEKRWAESIMAKVAAAGASHALLLVSHADARFTAYPRSERFAGYDPMPMHLREGEVLSLAFTGAARPGLTTPTVHLYPDKTDGFQGQIVLPTLTRPAIDLTMAMVSSSQPWSFFRSADPETDAALGSRLTREEKIDRLTELYDRELRREEGNQSIGSIRQRARELAIGVVDLTIQPAIPPLSPLELESPEPTVELPDFVSPEAAPD